MKVRDKKTGCIWDVMYISAKNRNDTIFNFHNVDEFEVVTEQSDRDIAIAVNGAEERLMKRLGEVLSAVKEQRGGGNSGDGKGEYWATLKDLIKRVCELENQRVDLSDKFHNLARAHKEALGQIDALRDRVRKLESWPSPVNPAIPFPWNQPVVTYSNPVV